MTVASKQLAHSFTPRGACLELFKVRDPEVLLSGPAGTGKSRACLEKLHGVALANPGMRGLIVRKVAASLTSSALVTWKRDVVAEALRGKVVSFYGGSAEEPAQYRYQNGSVVAVGGMDKASKVLSTEYDLVYVQEATELSLEDWETLTTRVRNGVVSFQQVIADCNPDTANHWLKHRCDLGKTTMLMSVHTDNPRLYTETGALTEYGAAYMGRLEGLTGVRRQRLLEGKWVSAEGVIFEGFDSGLHVIDRFDVPWDWPRFWSVDFGFTNPFVLQCWAEDPDGRLFLYRELYRTQRTVDDHARRVLEVVAPKGQWREPRPRQVVSDHDPEGQEVFRRVTGLSVVSANKNVEQGLQSVARRLRPAGDGKPRIFFMRDVLMDVDRDLERALKPVCTVEEIPGYVWDGAAGGGRERPVKEDDHGCDAMRYVCMLRENTSPARFRWVN